LTPAQPTEVFDTYWRFAAERQAIFHQRVAGAPPPWTNDRILLEYKFTNAYRASDRVSQYLIQNVIYSGDEAPEEVFLRTMVMKLFNRIDTWELLTRSFGTVTVHHFDVDRYDAVLTNAMARGARVYSAAYIMSAGGRTSNGGRKHRVHLGVLDSMLKDAVPQRLCDARSMKDCFEILLSYPTIGPFLAYQYITDLNYSAFLQFDEMDFVVPGPGAKDGIRKCFSDLGGLSEADIIRLMADRQDMEFERLGLQFQSLWGRKLQLIDCQNLFCEVDKYARVRHPGTRGISGRTRIKQKYREAGPLGRVWYPPKWGLNERIRRGGEDVPGFLWKDC
jgi:hypothetical protein